MDGVTISTSEQNNAIDSSKWSEMNFHELLLQKNILLDRYDYVMSIGNNFAAKQLAEGIINLDSIISTKL